jgi:hypothetical protein
LLLTYKKSFINNISIDTPPLNIPVFKKKEPTEKIISINAILSNLCKSSSINELISNFKINTEFTENKDNSTESDYIKNLDNSNINKIEELFKNNDLFQNIMKTFSMSVL